LLNWTSIPSDESWPCRLYYKGKW